MTNAKKESLKRFGINLLKFTAPALAAFFGQMAIGIDWRASVLFASYILYATLSDLFKKLA